MADSMTGFGRCVFEGTCRKITAEIKSVNHRYLELYIRIPREYAEYEDCARRLINSRLSRGKLELSISVEQLGEVAKIIDVNQPLIADYISACKHIAAEYQIGDNQIDLVRLLTLPEVIKLRSCDVDKDGLEEEIEAAINGAIDSLQAMRRAEGNKLAEDIAARVKSILALADHAKGVNQEMVEDYRQKLQNKLKKLMPDGIPVDENRLAMELVIFSDKCDITEETVRLESHSDQLVQLLKNEGPIGRKLDFILQEMNREVNTIGSKANNISIAKVIVDAKTELEKMREQAQNIE